MSLWHAISRGLGDILGFAPAVAGIAATPFTGGSSLLPLIAGGLSAVTALAPLLQGSSKVKQPAYVPQTINGPAGPTPDPTSFKRGGAPGQIPQFLMGGGLSSSMSPLQQRAYIASQGTQGNAAFRSNEAKDYYKQLANYDLIGPSGQLAGFENILPSELDYIKRIFGNEIRTNDTRGYLGALNRSV